MEVEQRMQGRLIGTEELDWLRRWIQENWQWSRKRIARELCQLWEWRDLKGRLKGFAARSFLLKLEAQGRLTLPALQGVHRRFSHPPQIAPLGNYFWQSL